MSKALLLLAALLTVLITLAHVFLGGRIVVDPLLASQDMPGNAAWLAYFAWHNGTVFLPICAGALIFAAFRPGHLSVAVFATLIISAIGLLGLGVTLFGSADLWTSPAPYAFNLIGVVAWAGIITHRPQAS